MTCSRCRAFNPEGKRFCGACGASLAPRCPACGGENPPGKKYCGDCGASLTEGNATSAPPSSADERVESAVSGLAERRQLTVMFCDLVGSTELAALLDPEDMREVIREYQDLAARVVGRFDGHVAHFLGDGLLIYFGYPRAHENDAERAILAGLELVDAVAGIEAYHGRMLEARIGIATGLVVVGGLAENRDSVFGETPNVAARLQSLAQPSTVVVAPNTYHLVAGLFEFADLGRHQLKGFAEPIQVWHALGESKAEGRFRARHGGGVAPPIGRDQEMSFLCDRWRKAKQGQGQVVLLSGEPGVGKSCIVEALHDALLAETAVRLRYFCSPFGVNSALHPVIERFWRVTGIARDQPTDVKLDKLEGVLKGTPEQVRQAAALLARAMAIPTDRYSSTNLSPEGLKRRTFDMLIDQFEMMASSGPMLVIFEDTHWVDPTTQELLDLVIERVPTLPVLLLITFRPEFEPPWSGRSEVSNFPLNGLSQAGIVALIGRVTGGKVLPPEVLDAIVAKTDGVPLFVEELTQMLLESGLLVDAGELYELLGPLPPLAIPTSLQDSLMARLDRLGGAVKLVAQVAAAIGREFVREIVACAIPAGEMLGAAINQLLDAGLLVQGASQQRTVYAFKHVLVRDAAYSSLLRGARRSLHRRIATCLETSPSRENAAPEVLANHWVLGEVSDKAAVYFAEAARNAKANYANKEALVFFRAALEQLERRGPTAARRDVQPPEMADLYEEMGDVLALVRSQVEATAAFTEALLQIPASDRIRHARLHRKIGLVRQHERDLALKAFEDAERALGAWPEKDDDARSAWVDVQIGRLFVHYWKGEAAAMNLLLARLEPHIARATPHQRAEYFDHLVLRDLRQLRYDVSDGTVAHARDYVSAARGTGDLATLASAQFLLAFVLLHLSRLDDALRIMQEGLETARRSGHRAIELRCIVYLCTIFRRQHQLDATRKWGMDSYTLAVKEAMHEYVGMAAANLAWVAWCEGRISEVESLAREALARWQRSPVAYPFQWAAVLPLIAALRAGGRLPETIGLCARLVDSSQQHLPAPLTEAASRIAAHDATWAETAAPDAQTALDELFTIAETSRYL
jgi:class 3 adenylate cyclase/tetratricopeptide (TPR) repeat protein